VVALNKYDLPEVQARWPEIQKGIKSRLKKNQPAILVAPELFTISASSGENVRSLIYRVARLLEETPVETTAAEIPVYRFESDPKDFVISHTDRGWRVRGAAIERAAKMTYWEHYQSVRRFQRILEALGIDRALREAGFQAGDSVMIDEFELEWQD
jgi:GTP-binding protein